jgi:hypothetical protein
MSTEISLVRRCRDQEIVIARLMREAQVLRDENADLLAQLEAARRPVMVANGIDRLEATLPVNPAAQPSRAGCRATCPSRCSRTRGCSPPS